MSANSNVKVDITASASGMQPAVSQAEQNFAKLEASANKVDAQFKTTNMALGKATLSAGQLRMATQQLPLQFQDIWVSLAAGQTPLMVLAQQGTQISGSFGGVMPALKAMGTYLVGLVNPITMTAAAVAAAGYAWYEWEQKAVQAVTAAEDALDLARKRADKNKRETQQEQIAAAELRIKQIQDENYWLEKLMPSMKKVMEIEKESLLAGSAKERSIREANLKTIEANQQAIENERRLVAQLKEQLATKEDAQQRRIDAEAQKDMERLTKAERDYAWAVDATNRALANIDPLVKANLEWEKLLDLQVRNKGMLSDDQMGQLYADSMKGLEDKTQTTADDMSEIWKNYRDSTQRVLGDQFFDAMMGKFNNLEDAVKQMIFRITANAAAANLTEALFGTNGKGGSGSNGVIGSLMNVFGFGGGRAVGGSVASNTMYEVNEDGPEMLNHGGKDYLMMGGKGGFVKPLSQGGAQISGGSQIVINDYTTFNIDARSDRAQALSEASQLIDNKQAQLIDTLRRQKVLA